MKRLEILKPFYGCAGHGNKRSDFPSWQTNYCDNSET